MVNLLFAAWMFGCQSESPAEPEAPPQLHMLIARGSSDPATVVHEIQLLPSRSYEDLMDLGTAHVWLGEYHQAAEAYEVAARQARSRDTLAAALYAKASAAGYAGQIEAAAAAAEATVRLRPDSPEAAWLRLAIRLHEGDPLGVFVARDHVMRLDPEASGHEVFAETTLAVVAVVSIVAATMVTTVALVPPEDRRDVVVPMFDALVRLAGAGLQPLGAVPSVPAAGNDLGRRLVRGS